MYTNSNLIINSGYSAIIYSGGCARYNTINSGGSMFISSGGKHQGLLQINGTYVSACSGSIVDFTVSEHDVDGKYLINNLSLIKGSPTYTITVSAEQEFGTYKLAQGAGNLTGTLSIGDGTVDYGSITVNGNALEYNQIQYTLTQTDGNLLLDVQAAIVPAVFIYSSGTLTSSGAEITGATISGGNNSMYISNGGVANSTTLLNKGTMIISSGGTANSTTVNFSGSMLISSGGVANGAIVNNGGHVIVCGNINSGNFLSRAVLHISSGGTATSAILSGGNIYVSSGGVANDTFFDAWGAMYIYNGGNANGTLIDAGQMHVSSGGTVNSTILSGYQGMLFISSGACANHTEVGAAGWMLISSGGSASNVVVDKYGCAILSSGASVNSICVKKGGKLGGFSFESDQHISEIRNGTAVISDNVSITGDFMNIGAGGCANNITTDGTKFNSGITRVSGCVIFVSSGGVVNNAKIRGSGTLYLSSGAKANSTTVGSYGSVFISGGGLANNTTMSAGYVYIYSDGIAKDTVLYENQNYGCYMYISSGGIHRGSLQIGSGFGAVVSAYSGAIIDFTVSGRSVEDNYLINDLSLIQGTPTYTITVSTDQADGTYKLAQGASSFNKTVSIGDGTVNYGSITVNGEDFVYNCVNYSLDQTNGNLTLTIEKYLDITPPTLTISGNTTAPTNQNVVLSISANENCTILYNIDNGEWQTYSDCITVIANGTVNIKATDEAGNVTEKSVVVDMIDKIAPKKPTASADITTATNQNVTVSAVFSSDSVVKEYSLDNRTWQSYTSGVVMEDNGSVYFRGKDEAGNYSTVVSYTVNNIDKVAPTLEINGNATVPTNKDVVLNATASDGTVEYYDGAEWIEGNKLTVSENGTYQFRVTDTAGNITEKSVTVDMIDKIAPTLKISGNIDTPTNQDVVLNATASDGTIEYFADGKWNIGNSITATENGTYQFRVTDAAGNVTEKSVVVDMIDKVAPTLSISGNASVPTNKDVVLTATASDGTVEYYDGAKWIEGNKLTVFENGTYQFRVTDAAGNVAEKSVVVNMIDKVAPTLEISGNPTMPTNQNVVLTATASDGTIEYFANGKWNKGNTITATENGTFKFRVTDVAGNVSEKSVIVDMIDKVAPTLSISGNVDTPTNKDVVLTATASDGTIEYFNGKTWVAGNKLTVSENGSYKFRVTDEAGNITEKSVVVDMIDKVAPTLKVLGNVTKPINNNVLLLAVASDGIIEYFDGKNWIEGDSLLATENGTYKFRVTDMAGNVTEETVVVDMIDKVAPSKPVASADVTSETKNAVTVSAAFSNDSAVKQYSLDNKTWYNYTSGVVMKSNGMVYFRGIDAAGNISAVASYEVNNIIAAPDVIDGDLDGNGLADVILVHTKQGYSGAWLSTGTNSVIKWGSLSNIKSGTEILGTGKLVGSADDGQDIFFADSKSVGAWNVVDGKVAGYKSIMSVNSTTNVLGLGDFNGDGATDLLLRSTSGDLGFYGTDGTGWEYLIGLGKEWKISAVGDLNGDGLADTIVRHDAGFAGTFLTQTDGTVKWANLDTLKDDMTIVGTGDFNGDGVDDVLLQKDDGWVGAWLVEDGRVDSFIGLCKNKNTIEQIADFNGDGIDDLRVRDGKAVGVLYVNGADSTTWQYFQSVGTEWDTSFSALA